MEGGAAEGSLAESYQCDCNPGKLYRNRATFAAHRKTQRHRAWEAERSGRDAAARDAEKVAEIARLRRRVRELEEIIASGGHRRRVSETAKKRVAASQDWSCGACRSRLSHVFEVDHVRPLYAGGGNEDSNLMAMCRECHGAKTARDRIERRGEAVGAGREGY